MNVEQLEVQVRANAQQFQSEMAKVQNILSGVGASTSMVSQKMGGGMFSSMLKANVASQVLIGTISKVANVLGSMTAKVIQGGSELSRMRVATNTVTQNMGMTVEQVDSLRASLAESNTYGLRAEEVIKTLALSGLIDMANSLEYVDARTGETSKGVNALVLAMKDLGASAGIDSSDAIERLTKFIRRGEASFADGVIEIGEINREYKEYGDRVGKSADMLSELERSQVRMNIVLREGRKSFGAYANTYLTSGKIFGSIRDAMKGVYEELGASFEPIFAVVSGGFLSFVQGIRNVLLGNTADIKSWAEKVAGYIMALIRVLGAVLSKIPVIGKVFNGMRDFQFSLAKSSATLNEEVGKTGSAMADTAKDAKKLKKELLGLASFDEMNVLKSPEADSGGGAGVGGGLSGMGAVDMAGFTDESITKINAWADAFGKKWSDTWSKIKSVAMPIWERIKGFWDELSAKVSEFWNTYLSPIFSSWGEIVKNLIVPALQEVWVKLQELWAVVIASPIAEIFKGIAMVIGAILVGAITLVIGAVGVLIKVFGFVIDVIKLAVQYFTWVWNNVWTGVGNLIYIFTNFGNIVSDIWMRIRLNAHDSWNSIKAVVTSVIDNVKSKVASVKDFFSVLAQGIVAVVKAPLNVLIDLVNSFIRGINRIKMPEWTGLGNKGFNIPPIPRLAQGGVIENTTLAVLGEAGREAVVPLENTSWMEELASKINGNGGQMQVVVKIGEEKIYDKMIDLIADKAMRSNANILNI